MSTGDISPESPEARRRGLGTHIQYGLGLLGVGERFWIVLKRVAVGTFTDGFTYAGNLAYLSLVTLFPFFIVAAAVARLIGGTDEGVRTLEAARATHLAGVRRLFLSRFTSEEQELLGNAWERVLPGAGAPGQCSGPAQPGC